jgi:hypothetical protein
MRPAGTVSGIVIAVCVIAWLAHPGRATDPPPSPHHGGTGQAAPSGVELCTPIAIPGHAGSSLFEGLQIETTDLSLYERFFEQVLRATVVQRMDHPQVDSLRGYCYRGVLIVVRQDLRSPRPSGWAQINFAVPDVAAVQTDLEDAIRASLGSRADAEGIVRLRLKPDVRRGDCRAIRLEVRGPEGFMIGFDQYREGTCEKK